MSFDNRKIERYQFSDTIEYIITPSEEAVIHKGVAVDYNATGLSLLVTSPLKEGEEILIRSITPFPSQTAEVLWSERYDDEYYKVGLVFL